MNQITPADVRDDNIDDLVEKYKITREKAQAIEDFAGHNVFLMLGKLQGLTDYFVGDMAFHVVQHTLKKLIDDATEMLAVNEVQYAEFKKAADECDCIRCRLRRGEISLEEAQVEFLQEANGSEEVKTHKESIH